MEAVAMLVDSMATAAHLVVAQAVVEGSQEEEAVGRAGGTWARQ